MPVMCAAMHCMPSGGGMMSDRAYGDTYSDCEAWRDQDRKLTRSTSPPYGSVNQATTAAGISASQRANVIDGMISAACSLSLSNDALFLGVACLDRYLAAVHIPLDLLQPVSLACLWAAAKYESAIAPRAAVVANLIMDPIGNTVSNAATAIQTLIILEASVLKTLDYRLASVATTKHYKHTILEQMAAASPSKLLGRQQIQQVYNMMSYLTEDCAQLPEVTGYKFTDLRTCLQYLCALHTTLWQALDNGKPYALSVKYSSPAVNRVACVAPLLDTSDIRLALSSTH